MKYIIILAIISCMTNKILIQKPNEKNELTHVINSKITNEVYTQYFKKVESKVVKTYVKKNILHYNWHLYIKMTNLTSLLQVIKRFYKNSKTNHMQLHIEGLNGTFQKQEIMEELCKRIYSKFPHFTNVYFYKPSDYFTKGKVDEMINLSYNKTCWIIPNSYE